ncbi:MAG: hypothetical protein HYR60_21165 [Acidobacteria bacterium]|nr:hypothetical protein [Acidobacteriota bacterium]
MADDFSAAAAKHLIDSKTLLAAARWDGAGYLAGYGVECAVKLIIQVEGRNPTGHLPGISATAAQLAGLPGTRSGRYVTIPAIHSVPLGRPIGWAPGLRYEAEGGVDEAAARAWAAEAERLYTEVVLPMRLDGVI